MLNSGNALIVHYEEKTVSECDFVHQIVTEKFILVYRIVLHYR